jgi:aspartate carbamoyltransferase catalytic subunit
VRICHDLMQGIEGADVINILRIQHERMDSNYFPSIREYRLLYGITSERLRAAKPDVMIHASRSDQPRRRDRSGRGRRAAVGDHAPSDQ